MNEKKPSNLTVSQQSVHKSRTLKIPISENSLADFVFYELASFFLIK